MPEEIANDQAEAKAKSIDLRDLDEKDIRKLIRIIGNAPDSELAWLGRRIQQAQSRERNWVKEN